MLVDEVAHPLSCLSLSRIRSVGCVIGIGLSCGVLGPAAAGTNQPQVRQDRLILTLDASVAQTVRAGVDPLGAAGLDSIRDQAATIRPLFPNPGDPQLARETGLDRFYVITLESGVEAAELLARVPSDPSRATIRGEVGGQLLRPSGRASEFGAAFQGVLADPIDVPGEEPVNDPLFPDQWALRNTGQTIDGFVGVADADIDAPPAWSLASDIVEPVVVAVLDTGVSPTHPDLEYKLVPGINVASDGHADDTDDLVFSHGTGCAGVIAAEHNNGYGMAGVAGNALVMPIRIFNSFGFGYEVEFVAGLTYAADNGAQVASMSIGFPFYSDAMAAAVEYAYGRDVVLVASTGNVNGQDVQFPALMDETVAVGATNNRDELWANSTRGPEITLVAPGVDILSTWHTADEPATFKRQTGTSFAAPQVAGIAALVRGVAPQLTNEEVGWILINSCDPFDSSSAWDADHGYGRLNAAAAVARALSIGVDSCRIDIDGDGRFTIDDIEAFVDAFIAGDPVTDLVAPFGTIDQDDLGAFVDQVLTGCTGGGTP